jgi:tyrosinase
MSDVYSAPGDPIFYLHHAHIDYLWNEWQHLDWDVRKTEVGGPDTAGAYPYNFFGDIAYKNVTLDYQLDMGGIAGNISISEIMDTTNGILCYVYE